MNITPTEAMQLRSEITGDPSALGYPAGRTPDDLRQIAYLLVNQPTIANPTPAAAIAKPIDPEEVADWFNAGELTAMATSGLLTLVLDTADNQRRGLLKSLMRYAARAGHITGPRALAFKAAFITATIPDPDWQATTQGPNRATVVLGRKVGALAVEDIQESLK